MLPPSRNGSIEAHHVLHIIADPLAIWISRIIIYSRECMNLPMVRNWEQLLPSENVHVYNMYVFIIFIHIWLFSHPYSCWSSTDKYMGAWRHNLATFASRMYVPNRDLYRSYWTSRKKESCLLDLSVYRQCTHFVVVYLCSVLSDFIAYTPQ